jgi:hypothetical protein
MQAELRQKIYAFPILLYIASFWSQATHQTMINKALRLALVSESPPVTLGGLRKLAKFTAQGTAGAGFKPLTRA